MSSRPVPSTVSNALPRPPGGVPGPLVKKPVPRAPSFKNNQVWGAVGVTVTLHPAAINANAMKAPTSRRVRDMNSPRWLEAVWWKRPTPNDVGVSPNAVEQQARAAGPDDLTVR